MRVCDRRLKRAFDILLTVPLVVLLSPLIVLLAFAVLIFIGRPIIFTQPRAGLAGRPFNIFKFRTMTNATDTSGALLADAQRLTPFGRILRSTTLDELPELANVLRGEMSLVGPRPLLVRYLPRYTPEQARRHRMRPGLTGLAVIRGRNSLSWEERLALDVWYIDNWSLWLDIKILLSTIWLVLRRRGVAAEGHVTMPEFIGDGGVRR